MAARLAGVVRWYKVGLELYTAAVPAAVAAVKDGRVFLDVKCHDIPATVAGAVSAATRLGVDLLTVHASGGTAMLLGAAEAAVRTAEIIHRRPPTVLGITLLTSGDAAAMAEAGMAGTPAEAAVRLARLARGAGLGGVVASLDDVAEVLICEDELRARVADLGRQISKDYDSKTPLLVGILKGAAVFLSDLIRQITIPCLMDFMATSSYEGGTESSGIVRILKDLDQTIE